MVPLGAGEAWYSLTRSSGPWAVPPPGGGVTGKVGLPPETGCDLGPFAAVLVPGQRDVVSSSNKIQRNLKGTKNHCVHVQ